MSAILRKFWRGQYPLWVIFWGFYVFGYLVSLGLIALISAQFHTQPWRLVSLERDEFKFEHILNS